jgi:hypothetical protein
MSSKDFIPYLKIVHGSFNTIVMFLFLYQGWLGLTIRRQRKGGRSPILKIIRRHRKFGPIFVFWGVIGFLAGLTLVYIDEGRVFEYPLHFIMGSLITLSLVTTFLISRRIRSDNPSWRTPHFMLGLLIIFFYFIQIFLGLGILSRENP